MEDRIPRRWGYLLTVLLVVAGAILVWRSMEEVGPSSLSSPPVREPSPARESIPVQKEREKEVRGLERENAALRRELDERSAQIRELKAQLEQTRSGLASAEPKLAEARREKERLGALAPQTSTKEVSRPREEPVFREAPPAGEIPVPKEGSPPKEPEAAGIWRRPAEPGTYETVRTTSVFDQPSPSARKVATIRPGTKVTVVGSRGEWLEVRSKHGNPPGFIPREDAMLVDKR